jgi:hypothetical protein
MNSLSDGSHVIFQSSIAAMSFDGEGSELRDTLCIVHGLLWCRTVHFIPQGTYSAEYQNTSSVAPYGTVVVTKAINPISCGISKPAVAPHIFVGSGTV